MHQIACELFSCAGHLEDAKRALARAVDGILVDVLWLERCPLLDPLRGSAEMDAAITTVKRRAAAIWQR